MADMKPLSEADATQEARRLITDAYRPDAETPTSFRDATPVPTIGTAAPVAQPGRPPMSQRATDLSGVMLAAGISAPLIGGAASLVLWTAGHADPTALTAAGAAPVPVVLALCLLLRRAAQAAQASAPATHHHHYDGAHVEQDHSTHTTTETRGLIATTRNSTPKK